jgi:peptidoglycan hydrolase CwlO-like protein
MVKQQVQEVKETPSVGVVSPADNVPSNGKVTQEVAEKLVKEKKAKPKQSKTKKAAVAKAKKEVAQHTIARLEARAGRIVAMIASREKTMARLKDTITKLQKMLEETQADIKKANGAT